LTSLNSLNLFFWGKTIDKGWLVQDSQIFWKGYSKKEIYQKEGRKVIHMIKGDKNGICQLYTKLSTLSTNEIKKFGKKLNVN